MIVLNDDMMLWHLVVDDTLAGALDIPGGIAFLRGFILKNRETGAIWGAYRFRYPNGTVNWYELRPKPEDIPSSVTVEAHLKIGLEAVFSTAAEMFRVPISIRWFKVPAGDPIKQMRWLETHDPRLKL